MESYAALMIARAQFKRPQVMGILNVTPDSFSDGGKAVTVTAAVKAANKMVAAGADIIDIGGESTRPGADTVSAAEEMRRTIPLIKKLSDSWKKKNITAKISIDTRKAKVAQAAIKVGAHIWNDVSALTYDEKSLDMAAKLGCPVILMHAQGSPGNMQDNPAYEDVLGEIKLWLSTRVAVAMASGVKMENITIDPGIGFGKRLEDNLAILRHLEDFKDIECPILLGASRKSYMGKIDGSGVEDRLGGSVATALWGADHGADIVRVHDVAETVQALRVWEVIRGHGD